MQGQSRDKAQRRRVCNREGDAEEKEGIKKGWAGNIDFAATNRRPHFIAYRRLVRERGERQKLPKTSEYS